MENSIICVLLVFIAVSCVYCMSHILNQHQGMLYCADLLRFFTSLIFKKKFSYSRLSQASHMQDYPRVISSKSLLIICRLFFIKLKLPKMQMAATFGRAQSHLNRW